MTMVVPDCAVPGAPADWRVEPAADVVYPAETITMPPPAAPVVTFTDPTPVYDAPSPPPPPSYSPPPSYTPEPSYSSPPTYSPPPPPPDYSSSYSDSGSSFSSGSSDF